MSKRAIFEVQQNGTLQWFPHKYQMQALRSRARFTFVPKGWRGGWTSFLPKILENEMRRCGPGGSNLAYFAIAPTLQVAKKPGSMQPSIESYFCNYMGYATYNKNENKFLTTPEGERALWGHEQKERTPIVVCHAADPDSFASMTALGGVADEVGQSLFKREAWNTLRSRMATTCGDVAPNNPPELKGLKMGRVFAGSTVYTPNWFVEQYEAWKQFMLQKKAELDEAMTAERDPVVRQAMKDAFNQRAYYGQMHPEMTFIRYDSTANPTFAPEEMERMRQLWPSWFFDMRMRAIPRKPAGVIIDSFEPDKHVVDPFKIPASWRRSCSIDFGPKNFYALFWAHDVERDRRFCYMSYHRSDLDTYSHAQEIVAQCKQEGVSLDSAVAGQISEGVQRTELALGGVQAIAPLYKDFWEGVTTMAAAVKTDRVQFFRDKPFVGQPVLREGFSIGCEDLIEEIKTYRRPVDPDTGQVKVDEMPEDKDTFHHIDCLRYYCVNTFAAMMRANRQNVRAAGVATQTAAKTPEVAPESSTRPVSAQLLAAAGVSRTQAGFYQKYGSIGMLEKHLDIDL